MGDLSQHSLIRRSMSDKATQLLIELEQNCKQSSKACFSQIESLENDIGYIFKYSPESFSAAKKTYIELLCAYETNKDIENQTRSANKYLHSKSGNLTTADVEKAFDSLMSKVRNNGEESQSENSDSKSSSEESLGPTIKLRLKKFRDLLTHISPELNEDEEIQVGSVMMNTICPLSQTLIVNAFKNNTCDHVFEKASILEYIEEQSRRHQQPTCPISGCKNTT